MMIKDSRDSQKNLWRVFFEIYNFRLFFGGAAACARHSKKRSRSPQRLSRIPKLHSTVSMTMKTHVALCATLLLLSLGYARASEGWEHEAIYKLEETPETYSLNLAKATNDTTMKFCFAFTDEASKHGIHEVEYRCNISADPKFIEPNNPVVTVVNGTTYEVKLDSNSWLSVFNLQFTKHGYYAFFAEHHPSEFHFEGGTEMALLKDKESHDVEPAWTVSTTVTTTRVTPWKNTMLGCLAVWVITVSGVLLIINNTFWNVIKPYALMFASGTLLSTSFALVLYESTHLLSVSGNEGLDAGRWTAMIMCGFLTSPVVSLCLRQLIPSSKDDEIDVAADPNAAMVVIDNNPKFIGGCCEHDIEKSAACQKSITNDSVRLRFLCALIAGDFFHNFTDGIFIGASFQCNTTLAWKIVAVTVAHEIPQELSDFAVLKSSLGFSTARALTYNVLTGSSVMLGGITVMLSEISSLDTGMLLAYGAGNYIYCATVHMFSQGSNDLSVEIKKMLVFIVGAIAIGLILLDHEHCTAHSEGNAGGHDNHEH
jgi:zinc transporter ZupT